MGQPTVSNYPNSYDDDLTLLGDLIDQRNFQLESNIDAVVVTIPILGNLGDIDFPVYVLFSTGEMFFSEAASGDNTDFITCIRGVRGTSATTHDAGEMMFLILSGKHLIMLRKGVIAGQRYHGLVGLDADKSGSPTINEVYIATDTEKVYVCTVTGSWEWSGNRDQHADLDDLLDDACHTAYHNDARAQTWHDGLSGGHVIDGDTHNHGQTATLGAGRVQSGLAAAKPSPPNYEREVYYATDTEEYWISKGVLVTDWVKIVGAPVDTIVWFYEADITNLYGGACPLGWTRYTALDGKYPKGAPTGVTSPLNSGGAVTHTHTYTEIPEHAHPVAAQGVTTSLTGDHSHGVKIQGSSSGSCLARSTTQNSTSENVLGAGVHSHTFTIPAHDTVLTKRTSDDAAGVAQGTTETGSNLAPFQEVIFCKKD